MSTRSLTRVFRDEDEIVCMFRHCDGYPSGHGAELAEFLASGRMVNGLDGSRGRKFNGPGCLAASMVAHFKTGAGGIYIEMPGTKGVWEEFVYEVHTNDTALLSVRVTDGEGKELFSGSVADFAAFCAKGVE